MCLFLPLTLGLGYYFVYNQIDGGFYDDRPVQYTNVSECFIASRFFYAFPLIHLSHSVFRAV